mmetsp:Transcript_20573/g.43197  ORF Transcript_20573/g.43197 Transcript_20573/m.43197 type:complete len:89 (-) Transcript_20573:2808-3074(-)
MNSLQSQKSMDGLHSATEKSSGRMFECCVVLGKLYRWMAPILATIFLIKMEIATALTWLALPEIPSLRKIMNCVSIGCKSMRLLRKKF